VRFLLPDGIGLAKEFYDRCVNVGRFTQSKVMAITRVPEGLGTNEPRVVHSPFQPHSDIDPILAHNCAGKTDATLDHDSSFLRIDGDWPVTSRGGYICIKRFAQSTRFAAEMI
jgi:hypothetical protein